MKFVVYFRISYSENFPGEKSRIEYGEGDGTVNIKSLQLCKYWQDLQEQRMVHKQLYKVSHSEIVSNKEVFKLLESILSIWKYISNNKLWLYIIQVYLYFEPFCIFAYMSTNWGISPGFKLWKCPIKSNWFMGYTMWGCLFDCFLCIDSYDATSLFQLTWYSACWYQARIQKSTREGQDHRRRNVGHCHRGGGLSPRKILKIESPEFPTSEETKDGFWASIIWCGL